MGYYIYIVLEVTLHTVYILSGSMEPRVSLPKSVSLSLVPPRIICLFVQADCISPLALGCTGEICVQQLMHVVSV